MLPVIHKLHLANSTGLCYNKMSMFCLRGRNIRINEQRITRLGFSYMPNEIHSHMRWNLYTFLVKHFSLTGWQSFAVMAGCLLLCMVIPYLLGSFNFGLIISRRKYHDDIRIHGSGNAGTTNMLRTYGPKAAALTLVGDMLKAALAVIQRGRALHRCIRGQARRCCGWPVCGSRTYVSLLLPVPGRQGRCHYRHGHPVA